MKINKILRCVKCGGCINFEFQCLNCGKQYLVDGNAIVNMLDDLEDYKKNVEELYDGLADNKNKNRFSKFSAYLNYGICEDKFEGEQRASFELVKTICKQIDFSRGKVLDVGCGRGGTLAYINRYFETEYLIGVDLSYKNILFCQSKKSNINFIRADAERLPFQSNSFDIVVNIESALHYPNITLFFDEVGRVLVEKGVFVYADIVGNDVIDKYKKILGRYFDFIQENDYTKQVLNAMRYRGMDRLNNKETIFNHSQTYNQLYEGKKKYVAWILRKEGIKSEIDMFKLSN